jgi:hypothetical protein
MASIAERRSEYPLGHWDVWAGAISVKARPLLLLSEMNTLLNRVDVIRQYPAGPDTPGGKRALLSLSQIAREIERISEWLESLGYTRPQIPEELAALIREAASEPFYEGDDSELGRRPPAGTSRYSRCG